MWWIILVLIIGAILWVHYAWGMSLTDRIDVALDVIHSSRFSNAEGYLEAIREDPDLVGWIRAEHDNVMLFRSTEHNELREIVDFSSSSFHPGLVIHYVNGIAVRTDAGEITDRRHQRQAAELLRQVRRTVETLQTDSQKKYDGFHI